MLVDDDGVTVHMDVPGVRRDRLDVELVNDIVTVDPDRIDATMQDGVLTLRLPKSQARKPRRIEVQTGVRGST